MKKILIDIIIIVAIFGIAAIGGYLFGVDADKIGW